MKKKSEATIKKIGNAGIMNVPDVGVFSFDSGLYTDSWWDQLVLSDANVAWEDDPDIVAGKKIVPYGANNNLPTLVKNMMESNNLAPGILEREIGLLHGQGPELYLTLVEEGDIIRKWTYDEEIWNWLRSWNYRRFIDMATVEYKYLKGFFVKRFLKRGRRLGQKPEFVLEVCPATDARLAWTETRRLEDVNTIYTCDFENDCRKTGIRAWPVWNPADPFAEGASMSYHNTYSFAHHFYSIPGFWGSRKWIMRSSEIPDVLKYLSDNGLALSHHIHSPQGYWDKIRDKLETKFPSQPESYIDKKLDEVKTETFRKISSVLSGRKNTGKYIETVDFYDELAGEVVQWKIEPLDQKIKDFIEAQLKISDQADAATTSGIGLHPALSNMMMNGKSAAGSEMLYALKLYLASDTTIPEETIMEPINQCIEAMWPGKKARLGFYHKVVLREENVSVGERTTTNI